MKEFEFKVGDIVWIKEKHREVGSEDCVDFEYGIITEKLTDEHIGVFQYSKDGRIIMSGENNLPQTHDLNIKWVKPYHHAEDPNGIVIDIQ